MRPAKNPQALSDAVNDVLAGAKVTDVLKKYPDVTQPTLYKRLQAHPDWNRTRRRGPKRILGPEQLKAAFVRLLDGDSVYKIARDLGVSSQMIYRRCNNVIVWRKAGGWKFDAGGGTNFRRLGDSGIRGDDI